MTMKRNRRSIGPWTFIFTIFFLITGRASADIPTEYGPIVIEPPLSLTQRVFDLTDAVTKAKSEGKPLFVHLTAKDCPPCQEYGRFLKAKHAELAGAFSKVVVLNLRTWLKGPKLVFRVGDRSYTFEQFKQLVGDKNERLVYPYYWLLSPELKQIKQLPWGTKHYMTVEGHLKIFSGE